MSKTLERRGELINSDITRAETIPTSYYHDEEIFERSRESIFARSWQFIGDASRLTGAGHLIPVTLLPDYLDEPLLLSRSAEGSVKLLSNVCTHRGTILVESECHSRQLRCRYHGRCFSLEGKFVSTPGFEEACDFPSERDNLSQVPTASWGNLLFASLDPRCHFSTVAKDMMERLSWLPVEKLEYDAALSRDYLVNANWALYIENYLEGFHVPYVHPSLAVLLDVKSYRTELHEYANVQIGIAARDEDAFLLPKESPDYGQKIAAYYYWLFPNTILNFYPWGLSLNVIEPLAKDRTRVRFITYVLDRSRMGQYSPEDIDQTEREDEAVVEQVQKGTRSRFYTRGRFSPRWEKGVHQFHRLLAESLS